MKKKIVVIGAGFGGLASAALLAKKGYEVTLLEKNATLGGRAMSFSAEGFTFDMGPSWYMMPEVFDRFFEYFGKKTADYYELKQLDPKYRIIFGKDDVVDMVNDRERNFAYFESIEPGSVAKIKQYLSRAEEAYELSMKYFVYKNYDSIFDLFDVRAAKSVRTLPIFENMNGYISRFTASERIKKILLYTLVFIGGVPRHTPALYSLMSHMDFHQGVYYPMGGIAKVVHALGALCQELGVKIVTNAVVTRIQTAGGHATGVITQNATYQADAVLSNADYAHTELELLDDSARSFDANYWKKRTIAPSAFIMYLGIKGKLPQFAHHTLFFAHDWEDHFEKMYDNPGWPDKPSMYICNPSKTDPTVAPAGHENLFILVPVAPGLEDNPKIRTSYRDKIIGMLDETMGTDIERNIVYERLLTINDHKSLYHAYEGTALGLAPTLMQTAFFRPPNKSKKVKNLFFAGQNTIPGVGVPMALISAELAVAQLEK